MQDSAPPPAARATLVTSRLVQVGQEEAFGAWAERYEAAVAAARGNDGLVRLRQPDGLTHFVEHFAGCEDVRRWQESDGRRRLCAEADAFSVGRDQRGAADASVLCLPSELAAPKWKTFLATWLAVFPLLLALTTITGPIGLPRPVQLAVTSLMMTASLTWFILPAVKKRARPWLLDDAEGLRKEPG